MAQRGSAVVLRQLAKRFGSKVAVAGIDLDVPDGSFYGLLGPNGAGKTTTLLMVTGLLRPDTGGIWVDGLDVWRDAAAVKARIGVLHEDLRLFERLSGVELLTYHGLIRGIAEDVVRERSRRLLEVLDLTSAAGTLVVDYSHGMRKKIGLATALVHEPRILFLDEPFEGIDAVSGRAIRTVLQQFTAAGRTVVFSSHVLEVVERLCDHVAIMHEGRIAAAGPLDDVRSGRRLEDAFIEVVGAGVTVDAELSWLGSSSG